jgi:hypothetical protein
MTTPSQAKINRARTQLRLLEKRQKQKHMTKKKVIGNTRTKKASRSLEEICAAKSGYEVIYMNDGTKSCRKRCVPPKPVRSTSQSRKCIAGTKANASYDSDDEIRPADVLARAKQMENTKKGPRTLEETCAAKPDYELIDMDDGTKSCRKRCVPPKPVRSTSQSRKCIAGTKGLLEPRIHNSAKKVTRTPEQICAARKDYELIDMDDGTKSCRKKCLDPNKPVRSKSKSRKCIKGEDRPQGKTMTKKAEKAEKAEKDLDEEPDYDINDENNFDDYEDDDEEDDDDRSFIDNDDLEMNEREENEYEAILNNLKQAQNDGEGKKVVKILTAKDCLEMLPTEDMKAEIKRRKTDTFLKEFLQEDDDEEEEEEDDDEGENGSPSGSHKSADSNSEEEYNIKEILDKRVQKDPKAKKKKTFYKVWWEGKPKKEATWETKNNLIGWGFIEYIQHYEGQFEQTIKKIIDKKVDETGTYYLVWWKGETKEEASWEPKQNLLEDGVGEFINDYENHKGSKGSSYSSRGSKGSHRSSPPTPPPLRKKSSPPPAVYAAVPDPNRVKKRIAPMILAPKDVPTPDKHLVR